MFSHLVKNLFETGYVNPWKQDWLGTHMDGAVEVSILVAVANNPHLSILQIESYPEIFKRSVCCILKHCKFHPYHVSLHQELHGNDFQNCVQFCQWA
jgi:hypothetical protein